MRSICKILAVMVMGALLPLCATMPRFGVQSGVIMRTRDALKKYRTGLELGGCAGWSLRGRHSVLTQLDLTQVSPTVGAYYVYHMDSGPTGLYNMIGVTSGGIGFGVGYDFTRHLGVQVKFVTGHNAVCLGTRFTF